MAGNAAHTTRRGSEGSWTPCFFFLFSLSGSFRRPTFVFSFPPSLASKKKIAIMSRAAERQRVLLSHLRPGAGAGVQVREGARRCANGDASGAARRGVAAFASVLHRACVRVRACRRGRGRQTRGSRRARALVAASRATAKKRAALARSMGELSTRSPPAPYPRLPPPRARAHAHKRKGALAERGRLFRRRDQTPRPAARFSFLIPRSLHLPNTARPHRRRRLRPLRPPRARPGRHRHRVGAAHADHQGGKERERMESGLPSSSPSLTPPSPLSPPGQARRLQRHAARRPAVRRHHGHAAADGRGARGER